MANIKKVTLHNKIVTDEVVLEALSTQGIDKDYVEFFEDYTAAHPTTKFYRDLKSSKLFAAISQLPKVCSDGSRIVTEWTRKGKVFTCGPNPSWYKVKGETVTIEAHEGSTTYTPTLSVGGVVYSSISGPTLLSVDPVNPEYTYNVLEWDYGVCIRRIRTIENHFSERWIFESNPGGVISIKHNVTGDFKPSLGSVSPCMVDGDLVPNEIQVIDGDEEILDSSQAYFPLEIGADFYGQTSVYADSGMTAYQTFISWAQVLGTLTATYEYHTLTYMPWSPAQQYSGGYRYWGRGFFSFNTSSIPDAATITGGSLNVYGKTVQGAGGPAKYIAIFGANVANVASPAVGDFDADGDTVWSNSLTLSALSVGTPGSPNIWTLNAAGKAGINKTGVTQFSIKFDNDHAGGLQSTTSATTQDLSPWSVNQGGSYRPKLVVTYTTSIHTDKTADISVGIDTTATKSLDIDRDSSTPVGIAVTADLITNTTVTTQAVSNKQGTTATGNGNITDTGGSNATRRGFCYKVGQSGDPTTADSTAYDDGDFGTGAYTKGLTSLSEGTSYRVRAYAVNSSGTSYGTTVSLLTTGAFTASATGLSSGTLYHFRAYATNDTGTAYGETVEFLTKPAAPTSVAATSNLTDKVTITWVKSTGATDYHVWRDAVDLGSAGDVDTFDDTGGTASLIVAGNTVASDGSSTAHVALSLTGVSVTAGTEYTYKVVASNATGDSPDSATDTGNRAAGSLSYQWQYQGWSDLGGATSSTYNDTSAPAGVVTPGTASASNNVFDYVTLSLAGESVANGVSRTYRCTLTSVNASNTPTTSATDTGYRGVGGITYQWQRSAADSDASYSNLSSATTDPYNDSTITDGTGRWYKCVLSSTGTSGGTSTADRGYRLAANVRNAAVSVGNYIAALKPATWVREAEGMSFGIDVIATKVKASVSSAAVNIGQSLSAIKLAVSKRTSTVDVGVDVDNVEGSGWLDTWANRVSVVINSSEVDATLTNFPVAIMLNSAAGIGAKDITAIFDELGENSEKISILASTVSSVGREYAGTTHNDDYGIVFDVENNPIKINSFSVYPYYSGNLTLYLYDNYVAGENVTLRTPFLTKTVSVTSGSEQRIDIDWNLPVGNYYVYRLDSASTPLMRNPTDPGWPYVSEYDSVTLIEGRSGSTGAQNYYYYYFFDWDITENLNCYTEIEMWDSSAEEAVLHVKVPSISSSVDTLLYLYYDAKQADNSTYVGVTGSVVARNVWDSNFTAVYHMKNNPEDSTQTLDSSASGNVANKGGVVEGSTSAGYTQLTDGVDRITLGYTNKSVLQPAALTIEVVQDTSVSTLYALMHGEPVNRNDSGYMITPTNARLITDAGVLYKNYTAVTAGTHYYGMTFAVGDLITYLDGGVDDSGSLGSTIVYNIGRGTGNFEMGDYSYTNIPFVIKVGELRISDSARSGEWIKATYQSMTDGLVILGNEETSYTTNRLVGWFRNSGVSFGIAGQSEKLWGIIRNSAVSVGIAVSATISTVYSRLSSTQVGISLSTLKDFGIGAALSIGISAAAAKLVGLLREAPVAVGISINAAKVVDWFRDSIASVGIDIYALKAVEIVRASAISIGQTVSTTVFRVYSRLASTQIGVAVSTLKDYIKDAGIAIGIAASATVVRCYVKEALTSIGIVVDVFRGFDILSEVQVGISTSATRLVGWLRDASTSIGVAVDAFRGFDIAASIQIGIDVAVITVKTFVRVASQVIGVATDSTTRLIGWLRESSVAVGISGQAEKIWGIIRNALITIGVDVSATMFRTYARVANSDIGISVSVIRGSIKQALMSVGINVNATRLAERARNSSTAVGIVTTITKAIGILSDLAVGISATATRVVGAARSSSLLAGISATAIRVVGSIKESPISIGIISIAEKGVGIVSNISVGIATTANKGVGILAYISVGIVLIANRGFDIVSGLFVGISTTATRLVISTRESSVVAGISVAVVKSMSFLSSIVVGTVVSIVKTLGSVRTALTDVGIETLVTKAVGILSSITVGVVTTATRAFSSFRESITNIGIDVLAFSGKIFIAEIAIGIATSVNRSVFFVRNSGIQVGIQTSVTKAIGILSSLSVGIVTSADLIFGKVITSLISIGTSVSSTRVMSWVRESSIAVGISGQAEKFWGIIRNAAMQIGIVVTATREFTTSRLSEVQVGQDVSAIISRVYTKISSIAVGIATTANKGVGILSSLSVGIVVSATRNVNQAIESIVQIGLSVVGTLNKGITILSNLEIGTVVSVTVNRVFYRLSEIVVGIGVWAYVKGNVVVVAMINIGTSLYVTTSRNYGRVATASVGMVTTASRLFGSIRSALVSIGVVVSQSRVGTLTRVINDTLKVTASRVWNFVYGPLGISDNQKSIITDSKKDIIADSSKSVITDDNTSDLTDTNVDNDYSDKRGL